MFKVSITRINDDPVQFEFCKHNSGSSTENALERAGVMMVKFEVSICLSYGVKLFDQTLV